MIHSDQDNSWREILITLFNLKENVFLWINWVNYHFPMGALKSGAFALPEGFYKLLTDS